MRGSRRRTGRVEQRQHLVIGAGPEVALLVRGVMVVIVEHRWQLH